MNWDAYFMNMTFLVAMKSKDPNTQVGCVIVGPDNEILTTGFNGIPRGVRDDIPERSVRPEKYFYYEHSERNAIYNAARIGVKLKCSRLYVLDTPCSDCARAIIQCGISEVIHCNWWVLNGIGDKWKESDERSIRMFEEAGIGIRIIDPPAHAKITNRFNGKVYVPGEHKIDVDGM